MADSNSHRARILAGAPIAAAIKAEVAEDCLVLLRENGIKPCLCVIQVGDDPASSVYVGSKVKTSRELGMLSEHHHLPVETTTEELLAVVRELNAREGVDGYLIQSPLPKHIEERVVIDEMDPAKDVDGFHPINVGRLWLGQRTLVPCTPAGIIEILDRSSIEIRGARAVIVGRSNIVGKPMAQMLLRRDATVTICHSKTRDLASVTREADILVAAIGRAGFIRGEFIKPGATVIDVGMNRVTSEREVRGFFGDETDKRLEAIEKRGFTLVGDVHPAEADLVAGARTPVPGCVGLLTVAMLMRNTVKAARMRRGRSDT